MDLRGILVTIISIIHINNEKRVHQETFKTSAGLDLYFQSNSPVCEPFSAGT